MEYEGLTNGSPVCIPGGGEEVERENKGETEQDRHRGKHRRDEEHHGCSSDETDQAGVPGEVGERGPDNSQYYFHFFDRVQPMGCKHMVIFLNHSFKHN